MSIIDLVVIVTATPEIYPPVVDGLDSGEGRARGGVGVKGRIVGL
jgi:hypothetical protein